MDTASNKAHLVIATQFLSTAMMLHAKIITSQIGPENVAIGIDILNKAFAMLDKIHYPSPPKLHSKNNCQSNDDDTPCEFYQKKLCTTEAAINLHKLYSLHNNPGRT